MSNFKIKGNVLVNGIHIADWFNKIFLPPNDYLFRSTWSKNTPANRMQKYNLMDVLGHWFIFNPLGMSIEAFCAYLMIFFNETGAKFLPIAESGGFPEINGVPDFRNDAYFFEQRDWKASYNAAPNRPAGFILAQRGIISKPEDIAAWNSTTRYPHEQPYEIKLLARKYCDFYTCKGLGLIQTTYLTNYLGIEYLFPKPFFQMSFEEVYQAFQKPSVYLGAVKAFYNVNWRRGVLPQIEGGVYQNFGYVTAGNNPVYVNEFIQRCTLLKDALNKATLSDAPPRLIDGQNLSKAEIVALQKRLFNLGNQEIKDRLIRAGGADGNWGDTSEAVAKELGINQSSIKELVLV